MENIIKLLASSKLSLKRAQFRLHRVPIEFWNLEIIKLIYSIPVREVTLVEAMPCVSKLIVEAKSVIANTDKKCHLLVKSLPLE